MWAHPHPYPSTPTPTPLPPSPGPWESAPSAEGSWPKDWGLALPHNRAIQPGGCQPCSACCPQDSLVCGSSAPGEWRGQIRNADSDSLGPAPPLPTTQPHFSLCPSLGGWGPQTFCSSQLSEMGQLSPCCSLLIPSGSQTMISFSCSLLAVAALLLPLGQGLSTVCTVLLLTLHPEVCSAELHNMTLHPSLSRLFLLSFSLSVPLIFLPWAVTPTS